MLPFNAAAVLVLPCHIPLLTVLYITLPWIPAWSSLGWVLLFNADTAITSLTNWWCAAVFYWPHPFTLPLLFCGIDSSQNYVINVAARAHERCGWQKRQEIACGSAESMATGPSPSTASTEINLAQQAIQLLRQSQGQSGTDRKTIEKVVFKLRGNIKTRKLPCILRTLD